MLGSDELLICATNPDAKCCKHITGKLTLILAVPA